MPLFESITDLSTASDVVRRRRYGVIEIVEGRLAAVRFRPLARRVSWVEAKWLGSRWHARRPGDRCRLYFNQPVGQSRFLSLAYFLSGKGTSLRSFYAALSALDQIARLKAVDAIVTDVSNARISDRFLRRQGWSPHAATRWHRHYIKRL